MRFSNENEEIEVSPETSLEPVRTPTGVDHLEGNKPNRNQLNPATEEDLRQLKTTLQNGLQSKRMEHFNFEPVSLPSSQPVSRVCLCYTSPTHHQLCYDDIDHCD